MNNLRKSTLAYLEILENQSVLNLLKKHWINNHENIKNREEFVEDFFTYLLSVKNNDEISVQGIKKYYNKKLKEHENENLQLEFPGDMFVDILQDELEGIEAILDFGCGKLAFLKNITDKYSSIEKLIGIDPKSQPILENLDSRIEFFRDLKNVPENSIDLVTIKLVLHHLENDEEIKNIFVELRRVLRSTGKIVVFEESFSENKIEIGDIGKYLARFDLELANTTEDFLKLSKEEKVQFLFLNDWLMNLQNKYMPWTMQYKSMEEWTGLAESKDFQKQSAHFLGAIRHRKRKQGMTAMLVFNKT